MTEEEKAHLFKLRAEVVRMHQVTLDFIQTTGTLTSEIYRNFKEGWAIVLSIVDEVIALSLADDPDVTYIVASDELKSAITAANAQLALFEQTHVAQMKAEVKRTKMLN